MRVLSRIALIVLAVSLVTFPAFADHLTGECALSLVGSNAPATDFSGSPHGVFRYGSQVFVLRGSTLTTYSVTALGDMQVAREDYVGSMASREANGGIAFSGGFLYLSTEAGLEIYDLRGVRAGGTAPTLVSRTAGFHYRRLAVNGTMLAGLYPATDLPCYPDATAYCYNTIDLVSIANQNSPTRVGQITSLNSGLFLGFNDIAFNFGFLVATSYAGTHSFNVNNPAAVNIISSVSSAGEFLVSNNANLVGVGTDGAIVTYTFDSHGVFMPLAIYTLPALQIDRANPLMFHPQAWFDEQNGRLITLVDEKDPQTLKPSRTVAFDVFDMTVPMWEGSDQRGYETVTYVTPDEVKYNPVAVGPYVYTVGSRSGLQTWGACGDMSGRIEWDGTAALTCGGADIHGWIAGSQKIVNVELFLDDTALGAANMSGPPRIDVSSRFPVQTWRVNVNLDQTSRGDHILRAIGTDIFGTRRQFASQRVFFSGPGQNCVARRRTASGR